MTVIRNNMTAKEMTCGTCGTFCSLVMVSEAPRHAHTARHYVRLFHAEKPKRKEKLEPKY
eukprot:4042000-Amphidinium_carterae.2